MQGLEAVKSAIPERQVEPRGRQGLCDTVPMTTDTASAAARTPADPAAFDALVDLLYHELRTIARRERLRARACATLCTTALVSEAWLRLQRSPAWRDRQHFLATAALAMRQVLVNDVHARRAEKRNHGHTPLPLDEAFDVAEADDSDILLVNEAVQKLAALSPRLAQVVECRFFAGFDEVATAEALGVTDRTVRRDWLKARAWLYRELGDVAGLGEDDHAAP